MKIGCQRDNAGPVLRRLYDGGELLRIVSLHDPADGEEDISALPDGRGEETAEDGGKDPFSAGQKGLAPSGPGIPFF